MIQIFFCCLITHCDDAMCLHACERDVLSTLFKYFSSDKNHCSPQIRKCKYFSICDNQNNPASINNIDRQTSKLDKRLKTASHSSKNYERISYHRRPGSVVSKY